MKFTRMIMFVAFAMLSIAIMNSCKKKCKSDPPQARILNNGSSVASVQIKDSGGNTVNINNVAAGTASDYASYAPGDITFTITVNKINYVQVVSAGYCYSYDIAIDNNNNITVNSIHKKHE